MSNTFYPGQADYITQLNALWDRAGGAAASVAGANTQVQFNDAGAFGASASLTFNKATGALSATSFTASGAVSGSNLSGTNTGDETAATIRSKLAITTLSGSNTGDQTITLTSDVTGSGTGSFAATIAAGAVTLGKMANLAANSIIGNNTAGAATPVALTAAQVKSLLAIANTDVSGLGTMSTQASSAVSITGGTLNSVTIGGTTPAAASVTTLTATGAVSGSNLSGTNTGDETAATIRTKLGITTLSGSNTGDQNTFPSVAVSGQTTVSSATPGSTLTLVAGTNVTITTDNVAKSVTINAAGGGGSTVPGGSTTQVQYNKVGAFGGSASFTFNDTTGALSVTSLATTGTVTGSNLSGTNTGDQTISITGDVTATGSTGALASTIAANAVTLGKMATLAANSIIGNNTAGAATPTALTATQVKALLAIASTDVSGLGTMSTQSAAAVAITGGTVNGATVGATTPAAGTFTTLTATGSVSFSLNGAVTAGTNAQGLGALTADTNVVTTNASSPGAVTLPAGPAGRTVTVFNATANPLNVYPALGGTIDTLGSNVAQPVSPGSFAEFFAASTTLWVSTQTMSNPTFKGNVFSEQQAPTTIAAGGVTLTAAQMLGGIVQYTGTSAGILTLPTGTLMDSGAPAGAAQFTNIACDLAFVNTGSGTLTLAGGTGFTIVGATAVTAGSSSRYRLRRTAAATWIAYRVA